MLNTNEKVIKHKVGLLNRKRAANDALFGANWFVVEMPVAILAGHFRYGTTFTSRLAGAD